MEKDMQVNTSFEHDSEEKLRELVRGERISRRKFIAAAGSFLGLALLGSQIVDTRYNSGWLRRSLMTGLGLRKWKYKCENPYNFNLPFSPLEEYARIERKVLQELELDDGASMHSIERAVWIADHVADRVASRMLRETDTYDAAEAAEKTNRARYIAMIAEEMANVGLFYNEEGLLSRAFNPNLHEEGYNHVDCDLIAFMFMHAGQRHNVGMDPLLGPYHLYLTVDDNKSRNVFVLEPTEFRKVEISDSFINYAGRGIGKLFSTYERQREHGGIVADEEFEKAASLHCAVGPEMLRHGIEANILYSLDESAKQRDDLDLRIRIFNRLEDTISDGTSNYVLANNYVASALSVGKQCLEQGRTKEAENLLSHAEYGFKEYRPMLVYVGNLEKGINRLKHRLGQE